MGYRKWCVIIRVAALLGGASVLAGVILENTQGRSALSTACWLVGALVVIAAVIVAGWKLRCPRCGAKLPDFFPIQRTKVCPHCGAKLE